MVRYHPGNSQAQFKSARNEQPLTRPLIHISLSSRHVLDCPWSFWYLTSPHSIFKELFWIIKLSFNVEYRVLSRLKNAMRGQLLHLACGDNTSCSLILLLRQIVDGQCYFGNFIPATCLHIAKGWRLPRCCGLFRNLLRKARLPRQRISRIMSIDAQENASIIRAIWNLSWRPYILHIFYLALLYLLLLQWSCKSGVME